MGNKIQVIPIHTQNEGVHTAILLKKEGEENAADFNKNMRAYAELVQVLDGKSLQLLMRDAENDGRKPFKILKEHYASTEKPRVPTLYEQLTTIRMSDTEDITDYLIRAENYASGLRTAQETISDNLVTLIAMIMKGLPTSYQPFVVVHTQLDQKQALSEFKAALTNFHQTELTRCTQSAAMAASKGRTDAKPPHKPGKQQCFACGRTNHTTKDCRVKGKLQCNIAKRRDI